MFIPTEVNLRSDPEARKQTFLAQISHHFTAGYLNVAGKQYPEAATLKLGHRLQKPATKPGTVVLVTNMIQVLSHSNQVVAQFPTSEIHQLALIPLKAEATVNGGFFSVGDTYYKCGVAIISQHQLIFLALETFKPLSALQKYASQERLKLEDHFQLLDQPNDQIQAYLKTNFKNLQKSFVAKN